MREDIIEKLTSQVFNDSEFSNLVFQICREVTRSSEETLSNRLDELVGILPKHVYVSPYLTLDKYGCLEAEYKKSVSK